MADEKLPVPPPDKDAQIAMLRLRVQAAEAALYAFETHLREEFLAKFVQPVVKQMHALNQQFPLGDETPEGAQKIAIDAIRAAMPEHRDKSDAELMQLFFRRAQ